MVAGGILHFLYALSLDRIQNDRERPPQWPACERVFQLFNIVSVDGDGLKAERPEFLFKVKGLQNVLCVSVELLFVVIDEPSKSGK